MAFEPQLDPDEMILVDLVFHDRGDLSNRLVLTSSAAYWPGQTYGVPAVWTTIRIPFSQIDKVSTKPKSRLGSTISGLAMIAVGAGLTAVSVYGLPQILIVVGLLLVIMGHKRRTIHIVAGRDRFKWTEPVIPWAAPLGRMGATKAEWARLVDGVDAWARSARVALETGALDRSQKTNNREHEQSPKTPGSPQLAGWLRLLDLQPGCSSADAAGAYHRLAKAYHPDLVAHLAPEFKDLAETRMREINHAYQSLKQANGW